jgi:hypothetical protein
LANDPTEAGPSRHRTPFVDRAGPHKSEMATSSLHGWGWPPRQFRTIGKNLRHSPIASLSRTGSAVAGAPSQVGEVRHPEREEPYRTVGAVHPFRRALV